MGCLGNSKTEDQRNEEKAQREANKKIEKQLQKDKQVYRATHRLLLLGKGGAGGAGPAWEPRRAPARPRAPSPPLALALWRSFPGPLARWAVCVRGARPSGGPLGEIRPGGGCKQGVGPPRSVSSP